jgi:hypothetical protein
VLLADGDPNSLYSEMLVIEKEHHLNNFLEILLSMLEPNKEGLRVDTTICDRKMGSLLDVFSSFWISYAQKESALNRC